MRNFPEDESDQKDLERLNAEPWQIELLKLNPSYCGWGPYEDYMSREGGSWDSRVIKESWEDFGPWELDDFNEVVNFYFQISRKSRNCEACDQTGYCPEGMKLKDGWYAFDNPHYIMMENGRRYNNNAHCYHLTQVEVDALWESNRLNLDFKTKPTPEEVNEWAKNGMGHDAINQYICINARLKEMGVENINCAECDGHGYVYEGKKAHVNLILWILHPRKGCSRGVEVKNIQKKDLPKIYKYLAEAATRNQSRFSKVLLKSKRIKSEV